MFKGPAVPDAVPTKDQRYIRSHAMERVDSGPVMIGISDIFIASGLIAAYQQSPLANTVRGNFLYAM